MKTLKRITVFLSILLLLGSCVAIKPQGPQKKQLTTECCKPKYSKREKKDRLLLLLVIIPTLIWIFTPKPLNK
jgi:hypothetical protein